MSAKEADIPGTAWKLLPPSLISRDSRSRGQRNLLRYKACRRPCGRTESPPCRGAPPKSGRTSQSLLPVLEPTSLHLLTQRYSKCDSSMEEQREDDDRTVIPSQCPNIEIQCCGRLIDCQISDKNFVAVSFGVADPLCHGAVIHPAPKSKPAVL
jgi:hypothetical protein